ncbi:MAG: flagellar biosynthetic protein FliR [Candidatus Eremiobacteraeota bacterium]|nr:flagellar biosynthetic protein FliR [Candidatus Eremiobacteraeota bacterium]
MNTIFEQESAITFILVLARVSGVVACTPPFTVKAFPTKIKVLLAVAVTLLVFPVLPAQAGVPPTMLHLVFSVVQQLFIGFLMGLAVSIFFAAIQSTGALIDLQIGFGMSAIVDPSSGHRTTVIARWFSFMAVIIFFAVGGHHWLILGLVNSFKLSPLENFAPGIGFVDFIIKNFSNILRMAFNSAIPILIAVILVDVTAGFIAKTAPQLNILFISFPFKIALGFLVMMVSIPSLLIVFEKWFTQLREPLLKLFHI